MLRLESRKTQHGFHKLQTGENGGIPNNGRIENSKEASEKGDCESMKSLQRSFCYIFISLTVSSVTAFAQTNTIPGNPVIINGNLGVGTNSPGAPLDVAGTSLVDILKIDSDRRDSSRYLSLSSYGQDGVIRINPGPDSTIYLNREAGTPATGPITRDFHIWDGNVTDLFTVIGATRNIGIGTANPGPILDGNGNLVSGSLLMDILPGNKVGGAVAGGPRTLDAVPSERQGYFLRRNDSWNAYNDGVWTGGNSSGSEYWENVILGAQGGGANLIFMTGGSQAERMRIDPNGNVGIGTFTPQQKLDIAGSIRISGSGSMIVFPDGTTQTTAQAQGPAGPQGPSLGGVCQIGTGVSCSQICSSKVFLSSFADSNHSCSVTTNNGACSIIGGTSGNSGVCCICSN